MDTNLDIHYLRFFDIILFKIIKLEWMKVRLLFQWNEVILITNNLILLPKTIY